MEFPIRINKYLAQQKIASRREADRLIERKLVTINKKIAKLGDQVKEGDKVEVNAAAKKQAEAGRVYLAFNKPVGVVTHGPSRRLDGSGLRPSLRREASEQRYDPTISDILKWSGKVFPLGRLDKESSGLIILTNDGRVTDRLLNPKFDHDKEYRVRVNKPLLQHTFTRLAKGIKLEDNTITKKAEVEGDVGSRTFHIALTEGKKHQIRRMVTALGYEVESLERVRILNITLGDLKPGSYREIVGNERTEFLTKLGLT